MKKIILYGVKFTSYPDWEISLFCILDVGIGYAASVTLFLIAIYYNVINAWSIYYIFASMRSSLPWTDCQNDWNTDGKVICSI